MAQAAAGEQAGSRAASGARSAVMARPPRGVVVVGGVGRSPARAKNASSSVGGCSEASSTSMPASLERVERGRAGRRRRSGAGTVSRRARSVELGLEALERRAPRPASASASRRATTCTRRSPTRAFSSAGVPAATVAAAAEHDDLVGEPVGLLEVLRGEQERGAVVDQAARSRPTSRRGWPGRGRWSARRGRRPGAGRRRQAARSSRRRMPPE